MPVKNSKVPLRSRLGRTSPLAGEASKTQNAKLKKEKQNENTKSVTTEKTKQIDTLVEEKKFAVGKRKKEGNSLRADVFDLKGKVVETIDLPKEIFGQKENAKLIAQAVRVYAANKRSGTASTKTRGEVTGSTRKIWRQKGTGRARHGDIKAPIFVHGGVAFGPKPRDFHLILPQKMRRIALFTSLSEKLRDGNMTIVAGIKSIEPKTKMMVSVLRALFPQKKEERTLFVLDKEDKTTNVVRAVRNIKGIEITRFHTLNAYDVLVAGRILFTKEAIESLGKQFVRTV